MTETFVLPERGDEDWDVPLNGTLTWLHDRVVSVSSADALNVVDDFGAVGGDAAKDTAAFLAAADAVKNTGKAVKVPPREFVVNQTIPVGGASTFFGDTAPASGSATFPVVRAAAGSGLRAVFAGDGWLNNSTGSERCVFSGLNIDCDGAADHGIVVNSNGLMLVDVGVRGGVSHGVVLPQYCADGVTEITQATHGHHILNCRFSSNDGDGIRIESPHMDGMIHTLHAVHNGNSGATCLQGTGWSFIDFHPADFGKHGLWIEKAWGTRVEACYIDTVGLNNSSGVGYGVYLKGSAAEVVGNWINEKPNHSAAQPTVAVHLEGSSASNPLYVSFTGNTIQYNTNSASPKAVETVNVAGSSQLVYPVVRKVTQ